ncbi:MAG: 30S ribosomal protein S9 [bacterium]
MAKEEIKFKGKYTEMTGRRKSSVARVRIYKSGRGMIAINGLKEDNYFTIDKITIIKQPIKLTGLKDADISIVVNGGGKKSQAEATRHAIAKALVKINEEFKAPLRAKGWLTRDARVKERKKPGLRKARRAPQWSKR